jgi:hypothetical protein
MLTTFKILAGVVLVAAMFLVSGWIANVTLAYTGCVWTSSGVFGVSLIALTLAVANLCSSVLNLFHFF